MFSKYALKAAAAFSPDGAKLNLLKRVRELFKKIKEINDKNIDVNEKDEQISQLLDATEQGETKPNIELFGPKTYLVKKEIDEPEKAVSILNYLPQFKTTCLETIGTEKYDIKMMQTIDYLSKSENKRTVALIATKINEKYSDMAGFTQLKIDSIKEKCEDIDVIEDDLFHAKSNMLETTIVNGPIIYSDYKEKDNQKEPATNEDLVAAMETLAINSNNGKASGGKRKTKRKNKKSKKSSRKKRKHRKTRKSKK